MTTGEAAPSEQVRIEERFLVVGGIERSYLLLTPGRPSNDSAPLVVDLHGSGFDPEDQVRVDRADALARCGAVVALPRGHIAYRLMPGWPLGRAWNVPGAPLPGETVPRAAPDDVGFVVDLVGALLDSPRSPMPVDPGAVHVVGYSGGARLAAHLPGALPGLASLTCVAGLRYPVPLATNTVSITAIHGSADPINPVEGGAGPRWSASVEDCARGWAAASGCAPEPTPIELGEGVVERRFAPGPTGATVRLVVVPGLGHAWPGSHNERHRAYFGATGTFDASAYISRYIVGEPGRADPHRSTRTNAKKENRP